jgi:hypothetical protein
MYIIESKDELIFVDLFFSSNTPYLQLILHVTSRRQLMKILSQMSLVIKI